MGVLLKIVRHIPTSYDDVSGREESEMRRATLRYLLSMILITGLVLLAACGNGGGQEPSDREGESAEEPLEDDIVDIPEVVVPVGEAFTFTLKFQRVGHATSQGTNMMVEEQAEIQVVGTEDLLEGRGIGTVEFMPNIGDPCPMTCTSDMKYEIKGYFERAPACNLTLKVYPEPVPGECKLGCPSPIDVIPYPGGIYDAIVDEVTFEGHEIGLQEVSKDTVVLDKQLGNTQWTNQYEIKYFVGNPSSMGCEFDF
jgi:hypothetical protein